MKLAVAIVSCRTQQGKELAQLKKQIAEIDACRFLRGLDYFSPGGAFILDLRELDTLPKRRKPYGRVEVVRLR
jgi:hypothetical protein